MVSGGVAVVFGHLLGHQVLILNIAGCSRGICQADLLGAGLRHYSETAISIGAARKAVFELPTGRSASPMVAPRQDATPDGPSCWTGIPKLSSSTHVAVPAQSDHDLEDLINLLVNANDSFAISEHQLLLLASRPPEPTMMVRNRQTHELVGYARAIQWDARNAVIHLGIFLQKESRRTPGGVAALLVAINELFRALPVRTMVAECPSQFLNEFDQRSRASRLTAALCTTTCTATALSRTSTFSRSTEHAGLALFSE